MKNTEGKDNSIGKRIKFAREEDKLSQIDLAKAVGFESATAISLIESGDRNVTIENLVKIANILHRNIDYFLGKDVDKPIDVKIALRADPDLTKQDKDAILHMIDLAKKRANGE
jgi:transcriptional regulator with XRE-family HTH domain